MTQKTLVIDLDRCIGCLACEAACKLENSVPMGVYYNKVLTIGPVAVSYTHLTLPTKLEV